MNQNDHICEGGVCNDADLEASTELAKSFGIAADNPQDFDFGFENERKETGFANFGFDPATAEQMRLAEQQRIDQEQG